MPEWIKNIQTSLIDLHDPSGSHFHQAWKACFAALLAAALIYIAPQVAQPIMVFAALIFVHKTNGNIPRQQQLTMLRAALMAILTIGLLGCLGNYLLLQAILLVIFSFFAQYAVRFGSQYDTSLTWILIPVAIAENPQISEIPFIIINVLFGFFLAFICVFWVLPRNPQKTLEAVSKRTRSRLARLLDLSILNLDQSSQQTKDSLPDLKRRIFSLIEAQKSTLKQVQSNSKLGTVAIIATDQHLISSQEALFEAIVILEQALSPLKYSHLTSVHLKFALQRFGAQGSAFLSSLPMVPEPSQAPLSPQPAIGEIIHKLMAENKLSTVDQVHLQSIDFATQNLCKKLNALLLRPEAQLSEAPHWKTSGKPFSDQSIEWRFDLNEPISRRSTRSAIAVLIALIVTRWLNLPHGDWVPVSALIVSRDSVGNTFWKAQGRLLGTAFGVAAAVIFYALIFRHHTLMFVAAFITIFPYLYLRPSLSNYGYAKFFQQFAYICFLGSLRQGASVALMEWRAIDIAIGCSIGLAVTLLVLPNWSSSNWKQGLIKTWTDFQHFFQAIVTEYQSPELDPQAIQKLSQQTQKSVYKLDTHLEGRKHETLMRGDSLSQRLAVIQADRKIYEALLYLSYLAAESKQPQQPEILPPDAQTVIEQITAAFIEMQQFIGTRFSPQLPLVANRCRLPISGENGGVSVNRPQFNFLLALNQLCEEIEQFGETRCTYTHQQNHVTSATSGNRKP